ncbi:MAG: aminotransferase class I/II-fold pyridoxal phosphate-dependent enzyme [Corynebacterium glucuronolyticum]|nr:aminotransferase class I/II-fold pyridoxal phosphate-dependent enzyme [Corynebacterium glucuronolyticum]
MHRYQAAGANEGKAPHNSIGSTSQVLGSAQSPHRNAKPSGVEKPGVPFVSERFIAHRWKGSESFSLDVAALSKYGDVINLSIGDGDFTTDRAIIDAAFADALVGYTHYGAPSGDPQLIQAIQAYWFDEYNEAITNEQILVTASSAMGMAETLLTIVNPGDEIIVLSPYFPVYRSQIHAAGGVLVDVPLRAERGYAIDEADLEHAVTKRTKPIIFNNPTNPTGVTHTLASYDAVARVAVRHDLLVIADEI